jgi:hypothetical protein
MILIKTTTKIPMMAKIIGSRDRVELGSGWAEGGVVNGAVGAIVRVGETVALVVVDRRLVGAAVGVADGIGNAVVDVVISVAIEDTLRVVIGVGVGRAIAVGLGVGEEVGVIGTVLVVLTTPVSQSSYLTFELTGAPRPGPLPAGPDASPHQFLVASIQ